MKNLLCGRWYRGKVTEVIAAEKRVDVFFVDYGISEYLNFGDLVAMPVMLRRVPFQAIECSCLDIEPLGAEWGEDVCDVFVDLYCDSRNYLAQVSYVCSNILFLLGICLRLCKFLSYHPDSKLVVCS